MLYHFLLIFPTGFKGVLATYQIQLSSYFSHRVFAGDILKMKIFKMIDLQRTVLFTRTCPCMFTQEHSQDKRRLYKTFSRNGVVQGEVLRIISVVIRLTISS
jgi:hypothetical protein